MGSLPDIDAAPDRLALRLDGFEGPLDLLLELARGQKVDLARISILQLVEQFLLVLESARQVRLELAADWLVMAAWLAWLKSRLLLPPEDAGAAEAEAAADVLAGRLRDLELARAAAVWLADRPQLGQEVFGRGAPEDLTETDRSRLLLGLPALLRAYLSAVRRAGRTRQYRPEPMSFWSVENALRRLASLVGTVPDWSTLDRFLPDALASALERRAALASTLLAGLEMARGGAIRLRQERDWGPIMLGPPLAAAAEGRA